ncbi:hypothetical protein GOP47_0012870 [Adiantum capillus-veneris]|uniref:COP1-interacting protein 7 n=1 Tax=Adiantum capillus-veneris TaxID=13818 RepID=A0A9D4URX9_ADICA|nr:hypothetical protein GOP47_0012870 [Adiantum capillus-veneris]
MDLQTALDHAIFQLTPTRTRYELFVVARDVTERMTSGLLKPFLLHLQAAEEQLAKGGYSIKLEPPARSKAPWFTKGTVERFVRFVSSPLVIERGNTIEMELVQLEETIKMQTLTAAKVEDPLLDESSSIYLLGEKSLSPFGKPRPLKKIRQDSAENDSGAISTNSKQQLLRALQARRLVLQKEQGMAFARAAAAGFELVPLLQLIMFAECFGAPRLRDACCSFVTLCRKRQIAGFCIGELNLIDQDISWALLNPACVSILKSMEKGEPLEGKSDENDAVLLKTVGDPSVEGDQKVFSRAINSEDPSLKIQYEQQLPSFHAHLNPSGQFSDWSNSAAVYQGWPAMYIDRNGPSATFNGYHYGYSPGSQQSFTAFSDMSPSATGLFCYSAGVTSHEIQANQQTSPSLDMNGFPILKKLQIGHRGKKKGRMATQDVKSDESFTHGYEKDSSSDMTDSTLERSDSSKAALEVLQDDYASKGLVAYGLKQGVSSTAEFRKNRLKVAEVDSGFIGRTHFSEFSEVPSCRDDAALTDASVTLLQKNDVPHLNGSFALHQAYETTPNVQKSFREVSDDKALFLFEQCRDDSIGSRSKKRLEFQEPETHCKQKVVGEMKVIDDSFFACSPAVTGEHRMKPAIESELQGNQIYDKMSKQALRVNSVVSSRHEPDDLLMLHRQRNHEPSRNTSDVLNFDAELRDSGKHATLLKSHKTSMDSQKTLMGSEPSQERVKNFLNHYNEKREAKLRDNACSSKRAEREGKLNAIKEDLDRRKVDLAKVTRPERARLQTEAQLRADKLRMYKADLLKSKKEKEEEEKRRLDKLKAQRQSRIAARSNLVGRSNANSLNPRGQMSSQSSSLKLTPAASRKSRNSLRDSQGNISSSQLARHLKEHTLSSSPKGAIRQPVRSSTSSILRQTGKASNGSQSSMKAGTLKSPQRTTSPPIKSNRVFSAVFNRNMQTSRPSFIGKKENSTIVDKKQGFLPGSGSGLLLDKRLKRLPSKEMLKTVNEPKQEGRTFLKKGSGGGAGVSSRNVQKLKLASPHPAMKTDKTPLSTSGTRASRLDSKQRNEVKIFEGSTRVATSGSTIEKNKMSLSTPLAVGGQSTRVSATSKLADSAKLEAGQAKVYLYTKPSGAEGMIMQSNSTQIGACSAPEKNHLNTERSTLKGSLGNSAMSRLMLFDTSCKVNGDPNISSTLSSAMDSPQTLYNQQSNGIKKLSSLGHMSLPIISPTRSEDQEVHIFEWIQMTTAYVETYIN